MMGLVDITEGVNFAFTGSALLFSMSCSLDAYAVENKIVTGLRFVLDTCAIGFVVLIPSIKDKNVVKNIMSIFDTNVLLMLSLFFTMAGQWAAELRIKEIQRKK